MQFFQSAGMQSELALWLGATAGLPSSEESPRISGHSEALLGEPAVAPVLTKFAHQRSDL
jgi:hypothetical protein